MNTRQGSCRLFSISEKICSYRSKIRQNPAVTSELTDSSNNRNIKENFKFRSHDIPARNTASIRRRHSDRFLWECLRNCSERSGSYPYPWGNDRFRETER